MKILTYTLLILALTGINRAPDLNAAMRSNNYYDHPQASNWNVNRDTVDALRHQVDNQETELRAFEQKLESLDLIIESVRDHIQDQTTAHKELIKGHSSMAEARMLALENTIKSLTADVKKLQTHANETSTALQLFKQNFSEWDQQIQAQNLNLKNLQAALQTLVEAFQVKADIGSTTPTLTGKNYKVKAGDTLEKIAKAHGTSVRAIMELNHLPSSNRIIVGKTLQIP